MSPILGFVIWSVFSFNVWATNPNCLVAFGTVSGESDLELVARTYGELVDELGRGLSPASLKAMSEAADPFEVPRQAENDQDSLRQKLKEFQVMVEKKGWLSPEANARVKEWLLARIKGGEGARADQAGVTKATEADLPLPLAPVHFNTLSWSPDGRYIMARSNPGPDPLWTIELYDRETRTKSVIPGNGQNSEFPFFSSDGKEVIVGINKGHKFQCAPFQDGKVDWTKAVTIGEGDGHSLSWLHAQGSSADYFVGGDAITRFRYDRKNLTRTPVDFESFLREVEGRGSNELSRWDFAPGTEQMYFHYSSQGEKENVALATLSTEGKLSFVAKISLGKAFNHESDVVVAKGGKSVYAWNRRPGYAASVQITGAQVPLFTGNNQPAVQSIATNAANDYVGVLRKDAHLEVRDGAGKVLATIRVPPGFFAAKFTGDGKRLVLHPEFGGNAFEVNYPQRLTGN